VAADQGKRRGRDCEWFPYQRSRTCLPHSRAHRTSSWDFENALSPARG